MSPDAFVGECIQALFATFRKIERRFRRIIRPGFPKTTIFSLFAFNLRLKSDSWTLRLRNYTLDKAT